MHASFGQKKEWTVHWDRWWAYAHKQMFHLAYAYIIYNKTSTHMHMLWARIPFQVATFIDAPARSVANTKLFLWPMSFHEDWRASHSLSLRCVRACVEHFIEHRRCHSLDLFHSLLFFFFSSAQLSNGRNEASNHALGSKMLRQFNLYCSARRSAWRAQMNAPTMKNDFQSKGFLYYPLCCIFPRGLVLAADSSCVFSFAESNALRCRCWEDERRSRKSGSVCFTARHHH